MNLFLMNKTARLSQASLKKKKVKLKADTKYAEQ